VQLRRLVPTSSAPGKRRPRYRVGGSSRSWSVAGCRSRGPLVGWERGGAQTQASLLWDRAKRTSRSGGLKYPFLGGALLLPGAMAGDFFLGGGGQRIAVGIRHSALFGVSHPPISLSPSCRSIFIAFFIPISIPTAAQRTRKGSFQTNGRREGFARLLKWKHLK
ncbi:unnamed protein product, partial [Musa banksii]